MYKVIRSTDKLLLGKHCKHDSPEELIEYLESVYGSFQDTTIKGNIITLHDSNLTIVLEYIGGE